MGIFTVSLFPLLLSCEIGKLWTTVSLLCARGSSVAWNTCNFVYTPENYPTEIRAVSLGVASTFMRIGIMITPFIAQVLMTYSVALGIFTYIAVGAIAFLVSMFLPVETMGADLSNVGEPVSIQYQPIRAGGEDGQETDRLVEKR